MLSKSRKKFLRGRKLRARAMILIAAVPALLLLTGSIFCLGRLIFAVPTMAVQSISLTSQHSSFASNTPGAWNIEKSAKWTGEGKARITFDVDTVAKIPDATAYDVLFLIDVSGSMSGEKLEQVQADAEDLTELLLSSNNNRIALVTFDTYAEIKSGFTSDKNMLLEEIRGLTEAGSTNYYRGFKAAEDVLNGYEKQSNRELILLFLTDGFPNVNTPNEVGEYELLKAKYPYMTINGIQYEMGNEVLDPIKAVSDEQFIASIASLNNVLIEASVAPYVYDEFILTDYIDSEYFEISSVDSIRASVGVASLYYDNYTPKITWDLSGLRSGRSATLTIDVSLKDEYVSVGGLYPTNKHTQVTTGLEDTPAENIDNSNTPVLKNLYNVTYDSNTPNGCTVAGMPNPATTEHFVFETVEISDARPTCAGYNFVGYEIATEDVKRFNDDYFLMPEGDVVIRVIWSKVSLDKTMDGTVYEAATLYGEIAKMSNGSDVGLDFGSQPSATNGLGVNTVAATMDDAYPIHYYRGPSGMRNNVVFADICWFAYRTTSTGGVKLYYNGEVGSDGKCGTNRASHVGYSGGSNNTSLVGSYYYGTNYEYDSATNKFSLAGDVEQVTVTSSVESPEILNKYTCRQTTPDGTCSIPYLVTKYASSGKYYFVSVYSNISYYSFGDIAFNQVKGMVGHSGYMYGDNYSISSRNVTKTQSFTAVEKMLEKATINSGYYFADGVGYSGSSYNLVNGVLGSSVENYPSGLIGKYTLKKTSVTTYPTAFYVGDVDDTSMYYTILTGGHVHDDAANTYIFGDGITDNGDGTYTINNPTTVMKYEWRNKYQLLNNSYTCGSGGNYTCEKPQRVMTTTETDYTYAEYSLLTLGKSRNGYQLVDTVTVSKWTLMDNVDDYEEYKYICSTGGAVCTYDTLRYIVEKTSAQYKYAENQYFGASVTWDGEKYTLVDPIDLTHYNNDDLFGHHYSCITNTTDGLSCPQVGFYYNGGQLNRYYITLKNGVMSGEEALDEMFQNTNDSIMKIVLEKWYSEKLLDYADMIEDTPFCNDRSLPDNTGWGNETGLLNRNTQFGSFHRNFYTRTPSLSCPNINDAFSVSNVNGNGKLTYPIGLITYDEMAMAGSGNTAGNVYEANYYYPTFMHDGGGQTWTISPKYYVSAIGQSDAGAHEFTVITTTGTAGFGYVTKSAITHPVISLKPGVLIESGDGTTNDPWMIEY